MLETENQIQYTLSRAGEDLAFDNVVIKGIPGHLVYNVQSFDSPYDIDKQDFDFQVSNREFTTEGLSVDSLFRYTLANRNYTFRITKVIDDLTGWLQLYVNLEGVANVS